MFDMAIRPVLSFFVRISCFSAGNKNNKKQNASGRKHKTDTKSPLAIRWIARGLPSAAEIGGRHRAGRYGPRTEKVFII
jgi:hypothetical protein